MGMGVGLDLPTRRHRRFRAPMRSLFDRAAPLRFALPPKLRAAVSWSRFAVLGIATPHVRVDYSGCSLATLDSYCYAMV